MVRAHAKQTADEKKESSKTRSSSKPAKKSDTTVWPCRINGCNKSFAREADLKRHQRTTKLHFTPAQQPVACPQCHATFTRTDALRRHQKSRHNGVILDPLIPIPNRRQDDGPEGSNASGSRSGTPNKGGGSSASVTAPVPTMMSRPDPPGQIGPTSYYRQNTIHPVFVPPRTPHGILHASHYQMTQIPTSATRFNGPVAYLPAPPSTYYSPGAYYRTADGQPIGPMPLPHPHPPPPLPVGTITMQVNPVPAVPQLPPPAMTTRTNSNESAPSTQSNATPNVGSNKPSIPVAEAKPIQESPSTHVSEGAAFADPNITAAVQKALQAVLAIDPSLNDSIQEILPQAVLEATQKALKANEAPQKINPPVTQEQRTTGEAPYPELRGKEGEMDAGREANAEDHASRAPNDSMTMLTEDGVAMLRPDELLNEETLSYPSPPP